MNPILPRLHGQSKVFRERVPVRPTVSFTTSTAYKLAKYLNIWFYENTNFLSGHSIKNSKEKTDKIYDFTPSPLTPYYVHLTSPLYPRMSPSPLPSNVFMEYYQRRLFHPLLPMSLSYSLQHVSFP